MFEPLVILALCLFLLPSTFFDLKRRRIPNWLTLPAILTGLALHVLSSGRDGFFFSAAGLAIGIGLLLLPFLLGGMGAGDVKLLGAIGALVGPVTAVRVFLISAVLGLFVSVVLMAIVPRYRVVLTRRSKTAPADGEQVSDAGRDAASRPSLPYGAVLAAGTLVSLIVFP